MERKVYLCRLKEILIFYGKRKRIEVYGRGKGEVVE